MKILLTGACGFVGSTLAAALQDHANPGSLEITGIDNYSRSGSWLNRETLAARGIRVLHGDLRHSSDLESLGPFDFVIDAAANPSVLAGMDGKSSSRQLVEHNLLSTINLLESCKAWNAGFILLSTSRVYSIPPLAALEVEVREHAYHPVFRPGSNQLPTPSEFGPKGITETFSTAPPVSLYGSTKLASETLALEYGESFGFPVWINRCGVMAGPRQFGKADQGIFAFWIHSWREGRSLRYIGFDGLGHQVRDCLHPRDLAPLILRQLGIAPVPIRSDVNVPRVINLSGGRDSATSLRQLSDWCADRFPKSPTVQSLPVRESEAPANITARPFDLPWVVLDSTIADSTWDWRPTTGIHSILEEIAAFAESNPSWIETSA